VDCISGLDEQISELPLCPNCTSVTTWQVGRQTWILNKFFMKERKMKYSILCFTKKGLPTKYLYRTIIICNNCDFNVTRRDYPDIFAVVRKIFLAQKGKQYHSSIIRPNDIRVWKE
jgi:hypothetical protein